MHCKFATMSAMQTNKKLRITDNIIAEAWRASDPLLDFPHFRLE